MRLANHKWLWVALAVGGLLRLLFLIAYFNDFQSDPDAYKKIAVNLRVHQIYGMQFGERSSENESGRDSHNETVGPVSARSSDSTDKDSIGLDSVDSSKPSLAETAKLELQIQPTAFRPPLYPLILSGLVSEWDESIHVSAFGVAALHLGLAILTLFFAFYAARRLGLGPLPSAVSALLVILDPIGLRQSSLVMTETLATCLATIGIFVFSRSRQWSSFHWLAGGLFIGICALCRPTFLIWGGWLGLWLLSGLVTDKSAVKRKLLMNACCFMTGVLLILSPWIIRNQIVFEKPIFATTHGGYTLYLGNNDSFYDHLAKRDGLVWDGEKELRQVVLQVRQQSLKKDDGNQGWIVDEVIKDRLYYELAVDTIQQRPRDFAYACLVRVRNFWSILPQSLEPDRSGWSLIQILSACWYGVLFLFSTIGVARIIYRSCIDGDFYEQRLKSMVPAFLLVLAFQLLHLFYWSNMRMRAPLALVIVVLAVYAFAKNERGNSRQNVSKPGVEG